MFRFVQCKVVDTSSNLELYLMHSFDEDSVCFDHARLNVVQTEFFPNAAFDYRTFRFNYDGAEASESQQQTIMCSLHLDPVSEVSEEQANACSCYTRNDCESIPSVLEGEKSAFLKSKYKSRIFIQGVLNDTH